MVPPHSAANGFAHGLAQEMLGTRGLVNRTEYIRVLEQALRALGFEAVAQALEAASGIVQQPTQAAEFRGAVLSGQYDEALRLLPSVAADEMVMERARFLLLRQKYLEGVQAGRTASALLVLRHELQPLRVQQEVLHSLAALLLRPPAANVTSGTDSRVDGWSPDDATTQQAEGGRAALLDELQDSLLPSLLLPERRLEELVEQALMSQLERSPYHNCLHARLSLFTDYQADIKQLPTEPGQVLEEHSSEVWCIAFSPDGRWAASGSKDGSALLWSVSPGGRLECPRLLLRGVQPCQLVAFSPDSRLLLTSSLDNVVRLHEVASARLLRQFPQGAAAVAVSWFPCSTRFLVASHKALAVYGVGQAGASPQQRVAPAHAFVYDAVVGPGGGCLVSVGQDRQLAFTRLADQRVALVPESGTVTSLHLSSCQRFLTTNLADSCVHLWHLPPGLAAMGGAGTAGVRGGGVAASIACASAMQGQGRGGDPFDALPTEPAMEFRMGQGRLSRFVLRSCVGGATSGFVACGAEDCQLRIWHRVSGEQLACLSGPAGCINAVAWHPNPHLIACASDDGTVRTWLAPAAMQGRRV